VEGEKEKVRRKNMERILGNRIRMKKGENKKINEEEKRKKGWGEKEDEERGQ
jgi:hypothetical protein